ncbi:MAG: META domain-containing protein [Flavobacteriaceae bacterium]
MRGLFKHYLNISTAIFLFVGCQNPKEKTSTPKHSLDNTSWELIAFANHDLEGTTITLNFETEKLHGLGVCNNYFSLFSYQANKITIQAVGATRKMCAKNSKLEIDYFKILSNTSSYEIKDNLLIIENRLGKLEYKKVSP